MARDHFGMVWRSWGSGGEGQLGNGRKDDAVTIPEVMQMGQDDWDCGDLRVEGGGAHSVAFVPGSNRFFFVGSEGDGSLPATDHIEERKLLWREISVCFSIRAVSLGWVSTFRALKHRTQRLIRTTPWPFARLASCLDGGRTSLGSLGLERQNGFPNRRLFLYPSL